MNSTLLTGALLLMASAMIALPAEGKQTKIKATPATELKARLYNTLGHKKTFFGHHDDPVYGHTWNACKGQEAGRSDVKEITGYYPGAMSWDLGGLEIGDSINLDGVPFSLIRKEAVAQHARKGLNLFSWHPVNPMTGGNSWDLGNKDAVKKIIHNKKYLNQYRENVRTLARYLKSMTDDKGKRIPVIFRPWHEMTGSWFWWGNGNASLDDYKALWKEMRAIFDAEGVDNVVWAYSPDRVKDEAQYLAAYPGDEYVNIMGIDIYQFNGQGEDEKFLSDAPRGLKIVTDLAKKHKKIPAFSETGLETVSDPQWYTGKLLPLLKEYPVAYVCVWRNASDNPNHFYTPFKGHPAVSDFKTFTEDDLIVMAGAKRGRVVGHKAKVGNARSMVKAKQ